MVARRIRSSDLLTQGWKEQAEMIGYFWTGLLFPLSIFYLCSLLSLAAPSFRLSRLLLSGRRIFSLAGTRALSFQSLKGNCHYDR